jgi:hypothetical protein
LIASGYFEPSAIEARRQAVIDFFADYYSGIKGLVVGLWFISAGLCCLTCCVNPCIAKAVDGELKTDKDLFHEELENIAG